MATLPGMRADVYFGDAEKPLPDWRAELPEDSEDDDVLKPGEAKAVVAVLGFDPREEAALAVPSVTTPDDGKPDADV